MIQTTKVYLQQSGSGAYLLCQHYSPHPYVPTLPFGPFIFADSGIAISVCVNILMLSLNYATQNVGRIGYMPMGQVVYGQGNLFSNN